MLEGMLSLQLRSKRVSTFRNDRSSFFQRRYFGQNLHISDKKLFYQLMSLENVVNNIFKTHINKLLPKHVELSIC